MMLQCNFENSGFSLRQTVGIVGDDIMYHILVCIYKYRKHATKRDWIPWKLQCDFQVQVLQPFAVDIRLCWFRSASCRVGDLVFLDLDTNAWLAAYMYNLTQSQKLGKIFTVLTYNLLFSFTATSDVYWSFISNKTTFTKYYLTVWISEPPGSFEIHWVRQYLVNFMGLVGIVNTPVQETAPIFTGLSTLGHGKLS